jgi:hypothetical protein
MTGEFVDAVDVSDICDDIDEVAIFDDEPGRYRARAFIEEDATGMMDETLVDLTDYPAVVAVCRRAFDVQDRVIFKPLPVVDADGDDAVGTT